MSDMFNQKEKGQFVSDIIWESSETYKKIEKEFNEIYSLRKEVKKEIPVPVEQYADLQPV
jgi:hypothetical protein